MPARTQLEVEADEPEYWPIGVDGSRTIEVIVRDPDHDGTALFKFGMVPTLGMRIVTFTAFSNQGFKASLKDLPVSRWEKVARAAAERRLMAGGPYGQHVAPEDAARSIVNKKFPELADASGGNALRRRNGLIHLAMMFEEYKRAEETGVENPAQVLAEKHSVSAATVRGWLHRARKEGLAPESTHPNAGTR
ncbi:hypothetical protein OG252_33145 [Streptomyces sp. NBC_01352]|uniref:hypothetical protein n=1 Tax=Streptomyces sp. NBC_01352 TaxID=2903834 RepID=UPI002E322498|nr:hypothetical protein [Streptomyces sp. NBC_01352]